MKQIQLHTAQLTEAGEYRDGGDIMTVGDGKDITKARAAHLVANGQAAEFTPAAGSKAA